MRFVDEKSGSKVLALCWMESQALRSQRFVLKKSQALKSECCVGQESISKILAIRCWRVKLNGLCIVLVKSQALKSVCGVGEKSSTQA